MLSIYTNENYCSESLCYGKFDGNYQIDYQPNHFVQCSGGIAHCQACWPSNLVYSGRCNQCLYDQFDDCSTTKPWLPATSFSCPNECARRGHKFSGNVVDPYQPRQYVACWEGMTVGCIACPAELIFNEETNACLEEDQHNGEIIEHYEPPEEGIDYQKYYLP